MQHEGVKQDESKMHENNDKLDNDSLMMGADDDIANEITSINSDWHHRIQWSDWLPTEKIHIRLIFQYWIIERSDNQNLKNSFNILKFNTTINSLAFWTNLEFGKKYYLLDKALNIHFK